MTINTAEIEARLEKITPGPWEIMPFGVVRLIRSRSTTVASVKSGPEQAAADAAFLASAASDIRELLAALKAETARADRYAERLEITSHWVSYDDGATMTRVEVPREDWDKQIDGIDCRDETIKLQDAAVDNLRDQLTAATEKLAALKDLVELGRKAIGEHIAPEHCYSTGPLTGDPIEDLVVCPACRFIAARAALGE